MTYVRRAPRLRTLVGAIAALLMTLPLAGCGDDPGPTTQPRSSTPVTRTTPDPTPTETTTSTPPTVAPPGETARQFIRRWVELADYAQTTGDTAGYQAIAGPDCTSCDAFVRRVDKIYRQGGSIATSGSTIVGITHRRSGDWLIDLRAEPTTIIPSAGQKAERLDGGRYRFIAIIGKVQGTFLLGSFFNTDS